MSIKVFDIESLQNFQPKPFIESLGYGRFVVWTGKEYLIFRSLNYNFYNLHSISECYVPHDDFFNTNCLENKASKANPKQHERAYEVFNQLTTLQEIEREQSSRRGVFKVWSLR